MDAAVKTVQDKKDLRAKMEDMQIGYLNDVLALVKEDDKKLEAEGKDIKSLDMGWRLLRKRDDKFFKRRLCRRGNYILKAMWMPEMRPEAEISLLGQPEMPKLIIHPWHDSEKYFEIVSFSSASDFCSIRELKELQQVLDDYMKMMPELLNLEWAK